MVFTWEQFYGAKKTTILYDEFGNIVLNLMTYLPGDNELMCIKEYTNIADHVDCQQLILLRNQDETFTNNFYHGMEVRKSKD